MSNSEDKTIMDAQALEDNEVAERYFREGIPFPPDLVHRIQARAAAIRERLIEQFGEVDVDKLIHESPNE